MANKILGIEDASVSADFLIEKQGRTWIDSKTWERCYLVLATNLSQTEDQISNTAGIPAKGSIVNNAVCKGARVEEVARVIHPTTHVPTMLWKVTTSFDSKVDVSQIKDDPTDIRPKRRIYTEKVDELVELDWDGVPIETTAEEQIVTEFPFPDIIMEIERYEVYPPNLLTLYNYVHHTNDATFYGAPIGAAYIDDIQIDEEYLNNTVLLKTRYVLRFRIREGTMAFLADTFAKYKPLNSGYLYRKTAGAKPEKFMVNGQNIKVNLNTNGTENTSATPVELDFRRAPYADFSALNLEF